MNKSINQSKQSYVESLFLEQSARSPAALSAENLVRVDMRKKGQQTVVVTETRPSLAGRTAVNARYFEAKRGLSQLSAEAQLYCQGKHQPCDRLLKQFAIMAAEKLATECNRSAAQLQIITLAAAMNQSRAKPLYTKKSISEALGISERAFFKSWLNHYEAAEKLVERIEAEIESAFCY